MTYTHTLIRCAIAAGLCAAACGGTDQATSPDGAPMDSRPLADAQPADALVDATPVALIDANATVTCAGLGLIAFNMNDSATGAHVQSVLASPDGSITLVGEPVSLGGGRNVEAIAMADDGAFALITVIAASNSLIRVDFDDSCRPIVTDRLGFDAPPTGVAFGPNQHTALVPSFRGAAPQNAKLSVVDLQGGPDMTATAPIRLWDFPSFSTPGFGEYATVATARSGHVALVPNVWNGDNHLSILVYDEGAAAFVPSASIPAPLGGPKSIAVSPTGDLALVGGASNVLAYRVSGSGEVTAGDVVSVGSGPWGIDISADGTFALATAYYDHTVLLLAISAEGDVAATDAMVRTGDDSQENPIDVAISPYGNVALVANRLGLDVAIIDVDTTATPALVHSSNLTITIANGPIRVAFTRASE